MTSLGLAGEAGIFASLPFYPMFSGVPNGPLRLSPPQVHAAVHNSGSTPLLTVFVTTLALFLFASCGSTEGNGQDTMRAKYFSPNYTTARTQFRTAAEKAGGRLTVLQLDAKGPKGEDLTIDIAWFGAEKPKRALVHSSGLHGVEAFAGSAIQLQWLEEGIPSIPADSALVLVHVLNPFGMSWLRRFNENSVDLNRNFLGPDETYEGTPAGYPLLDPFLNPPSPPGWDLLYYPRAGWLIARHGMSTLRQSIAGGQYEYPKGLFFGGSKLEEGSLKVQEFMRERLDSAEHVVVVDVHTGLGPFAYDTLFVHAGDEGSEIYQVMKRTFGERVASLDPDRGPAYRVKGAYDTMYPRVVSGGKEVVYFLCQEFGTYYAVQALRALRDENRWHHYGDGTVDHPAKEELKEKFSPDDESWRQTVLDRGRVVIGQGLGLAFGD